MADITPQLPSALRLLGQASKPDPATLVTSRLLQVNLQSDPPGVALANRYEQTNHNTGVVSIATKAYMDSIGAAKFTVWERKDTVRKSMGGYERDDEYEPADPDHPLCKILEMPGGEEGAWSMGQECVYLTLQHLLTGDAPVWTPVNADGKPVQFYSLTSALVQPQFGWGVNPQYPQGAYRVMPYTMAGFFAGGTMLTSALLPGEEVKRFREPHPWARNLGLSRLQAGGREIDVLEAITQSRWAAFQNKAQLDTLVMMPGATDDQVQVFYEKFNQRMTGPGNAGRVLVLGGGFADTGGKAGVSKLGPDVPEMGYNNSYDGAAGVVLALFRVPKGVAGFTSQSSYSQHYAELQQFYDLGLHPYGRALSGFLTQTLARPWSEYPGQFKIECEIPAPKNLEAEDKERQFALTNNVTSVNEYRKATGRKPVEGGDVPKVVWDAKAQQSVQPPQPAPGEAPPDGGGGEGGGDPLAALLGGNESDEGGDEDVQGQVTGAALKALGVDGDDEPGAVQKAVQANAKHRNEGETWQVGQNWYKKKNGKTVGIADPSKQRVANPSAKKPEPKAPTTSGEAQPAPTPEPASPKQVAQNHDALAQKLLAGRPSLRLLIAGKGGTAGHTITDGASLKAFLDKGGSLPPQVYEESARSVQAPTPQAQQTLRTAGTWAKSQADKHADRVAAHFGISRDRAHALLVDAIQKVAAHAAKTGTKPGAVTIRNKQTGKTATLSKPTAGAVPTPANPDAAGSLPPQAKAMSACADSGGGTLVAAAVRKPKKKKKNKRALIDRVLKSLEVDRA